MNYQATCKFDIEHYSLRELEYINEITNMNKASELSLLLTAITGNKITPEEILGKESQGKTLDEALADYLGE